MVTTVTVTVNVTSVKSDSVTVTLAWDGTKWGCKAHLANVLVDYTASALLLSSSGTALYATMDVTGTPAVGDTLSVSEIVDTLSENNIYRNQDFAKEHVGDAFAEGCGSPGVTLILSSAAEDQLA